jgi:DNA helicase IV
MPAGEIASTREAASTELARERDHVHGLYARLDRTRDTVRVELDAVRRHDPGSGHQARSERDAFARMYEDRLTQLRDVEDRLVFGRLEVDQTDDDGRPSVHYIGRLGLRDENFIPVLLDWRVPQASAFYQATAATPLGARSRRHLHTRGRDVVAIDDEIFDRDLLESASAAEAGTLQGEAALMAALTAQRTGRMHDIVATIQAEQDRIIRADLRGALVVQGGPGTGKTAVALHRAAYLLYTHRDRLASAGVLVVGPSRSFLEYIEAVLPSLGETGVVMTSLGTLFPGVEATTDEAPEVATLKGDLSMVRLLARAVKSRQVVPEHDQEATIGRWRGVIPASLVHAAMQRAWDSRRPHNVARVTFNKAAIRAIADLIDGPASGDREYDADRAMVIEEIRSSHDVRVILNTAWMPLTPQKLLQDLYARPNWLASITQRWTPQRRALLLRGRDEPFTVSDVPLLDEVAELLGVAAIVDARSVERERQERMDLENAEQAIRNMGVEGMVDARSIAAAFADAAPRPTAAENAVGDRTWTFGHIVVDEAQELSPMQWRMLVRKNPLKSFTIVGDVAQVSSAAGATDWASMLSPIFRDSWRLEELTVNYRTPALVSEVAESMAVAGGVPITRTSAVRTGEWPVEIITTTPERITGGVVEAVALVRESGSGTIAVITTDATVAAVHEAMIEAIPGEVARGAMGLRRPVAVLTPGESKGLEFDAVVVVEPTAIVESGPRGAGSLYVAMTRPTQRLVLVASRELPAGVESGILAAAEHRAG